MARPAPSALSSAGLNHGSIVTCQLLDRFPLLIPPLYLRISRAPNLSERILAPFSSAVLKWIWVLSPALCPQIRDSTFYQEGLDAAARCSRMVYTIASNFI